MCHFLKLPRINSEDMHKMKKDFIIKLTQFIFLKIVSNMGNSISTKVLKHNQHALSYGLIFGGEAY